jgi:hypothetical protein
MRFLVYGRDGAAFDYEPSERDEEHQAYMDGWLPRLIARGPTLSPDGADHTGSVHVIEADDANMARRFAVQDPYARAGWYAEVSVWPMLPLLAGTMWDQPVPARNQPAAFVLARWAARPADEVQVDATGWLFAGMLLSDDPLFSVGFAGTVDLAPGEAARLLRGCPGEVEVHRWERGGRRDPST